MKYNKHTTLHQQCKSLQKVKITAFFFLKKHQKTYKSHLFRLKFLHFPSI